MALEKAKLLVETEGKWEEIAVQFNPSEYNLSENVNYSEKNIPGFPGPIIQFVSGTASTLQLSLTFDSFDTPKTGVRPVVANKKVTDMPQIEPKDVTQMTNKVANLVQIKGELHRPPMIEFAWGSLHFKGIITDVKQNFTMFLPDGKPVRARLELTIKSVTDIAAKKKESPFESPDRTKYRTIHEGENLWNFAVREYGDPELWRVIAKENNILNPLDITVGQVIKLPAL